MSTETDTPPSAESIPPGIITPGVWVVVLQPLPDDVPGDVRMRRALKCLLRAFNIECRFAGDRVPLPVGLARKKPKLRKRREARPPAPKPADLLTMPESVAG